MRLNCHLDPVKLKVSASASTIVCCTYFQLCFRWRPSICHMFYCTCTEDVDEKKNFGRSAHFLTRRETRTYRSCLPRFHRHL